MYRRRIDGYDSLDRSDNSFVSNRHCNKVGSRRFIRGRNRRCQSSPQRQRSLHGPWQSAAKPQYSNLRREDWQCPRCKHVNFGRREECQKCRQHRPRSISPSLRGIDVAAGQPPGPLPETVSAGAYHRGAVGPQQPYGWGPQYGPYPYFPAAPFSWGCSGPWRDYAAERPEAYRAFLQHVRQGDDGVEVVLSDHMCLDHHVPDLLLCLESWLMREYGGRQPTTGQPWRLGLLDLARNGLADDSIARIVERLKQLDVRLRRLNLDANGAGDAGMLALVEYLWNCPEPLFEIGLAENRISVRTPDTEDNPVSALLRCLYNHPGYPRKTLSGDCTHTQPLMLRLRGNAIIGGNELLRQIEQKGGSERVRFCSSPEAYETGNAEEFLAVFLPEFLEQGSAALVNGDVDVTRADLADGHLPPKCEMADPESRQDPCISSASDSSSDASAADAPQPQSHSEMATAKEGNDVPADLEPSRRAPQESVEVYEKVHGRKRVKRRVLRARKAARQAAAIHANNFDSNTLVNGTNGELGEAHTFEEDAGVMGPSQPPKENGFPGLSGRSHSPHGGDSPVIRNRRGPRHTRAAAPPVESKLGEATGAFGSHRSMPSRHGRESLRDNDDALFAGGISEGHRARGHVTVVRDTFALVDFGARVEGLLHIMDLARPTRRVDNVLTVGDEVTVQVIGICKRRGRVSLRQTRRDLRGARILKRRKRRSTRAAVLSAAPRLHTDERQLCEERMPAELEEVAAATERGCFSKMAAGRSRPQALAQTPGSETVSDPVRQPGVISDTGAMTELHEGAVTAVNVAAATNTVGLAAAAEASVASAKSKAALTGTELTPTSMPERLSNAFTDGVNHSKAKDSQSVTGTRDRSKDPPNDTFGDMVDDTLSEEEQRYLEQDVAAQLEDTPGLPPEPGAKEMLSEFVVCLLLAHKRPSEVQKELKGFLASNTAGFVAWLTVHLKGPWLRARRARAGATPKAALTRSRKPG